MQLNKMCNKMIYQNYSRNNCIVNYTSTLRIFFAAGRGLGGVTRTQSHGAPKAPMTPPKPRPAAKKIRSVDV